MKRDFRIQQAKGSLPYEDSFLYRKENEAIYPLDNKRQNKFSSRTIVDSLREAFLPRGYPDSVSSDYFEYQVWDSLQAFSSNVAGALSLHSTLEALGVGKSSASTLAATLTWLLKDGVGMVSSIVFAYWKGSDFDSNNKQWRMFADVACDATNLLKLLGPLLPIPVLVTLCFSSIMLSLVGVAGGATRASLINHQAKCNNAADVAAKDGSQETMVNLFGLITSVTILPYITSNIILTWTAFFACVLIHLYTNYKAMRSLQIKTLNRPRLLHILEAWTMRATIPDVVSTNKVEPLLFGPAFRSNYLSEDFEALLGCSLDHVVNSCPEFAERIPSLFERETFEKYGEQFIVHFDEGKKRLLVLFHEGAGPEDCLLSFWACYLFCINHPSSDKKKIDSKFIIGSSTDTEFLIRDTVKLARNTFGEFYSNLVERGWSLEPLRLNVGEWRFKMEEC